MEGAWPAAGTSSPDKFGNGHQFIAAVFQSLHNGVHRRHRGSVNVMHQNDGAGFGAVHGAGGHHGGAGLAQSFVSTSHMTVVKPKRWRAQDATPAFV